MKKFIYILVSMLLPICGYAADKVYVQSVRANVLSGPAFSAQVISVAPKGSEMTAAFVSGNWYRVTYNGKSGWISRYQVSKQKPVKQISFFGRVGNFFKKDDARRRASRTTVVGAVRGLSADGEGANTEAVDYKALEKMNEMSVDEQVVLRFLEDGLAGG
jgi:uncharacterized protein YgiM (DUF1202 family)